MIDSRMLWGGHVAAELQPPEVYRRRRDALRGTLGRRAIAVLYGASDGRGYGDVGSFRQDPSFFYLTGVELPGAALAMTAEEEILFLPARRPHLEAWTGPKLAASEETAELLGFDQVLERGATEIVVEARRRPQPSFEDRVAEAVSAGATLWLALPAPSSAGPLSDELRLAAALRDRLPSFTLRDLTPLINEMRLVKDGGEVALQRKAVGVTVTAMRAAAAAVRPGAREGAVEGAAFAALREAGAEGWAFPPIVGSGVAGCVLHYDHNRGVLADGELVIVDIGARFGYYCGDLTRTFPVAGRFSPRQRALYGAVFGAQQAAVAELRPGATLAAARTAAFGALQACGLTGDDGRPLGEFFIHGIGHFLGLETHDVGGEAPTLRSGMVVTVEPGVYLPKEELGIRIEDDWLITEEGAECLSADLPRDPDGVESLTASTG